ncbi:uncharacterized protein F4807DRAFT_102138 [Annulohypoxylon truncatum]|uniref:uncharacterized protein n=1 Tax=Annulohypoxylon truncatum TaxID=327061 RepID=UPI0020089EAE|nr:uncharacterized protein F4807DRAFT_102138 [Annulohypoxylon truncatum]KAI1209268.1 hypothetical protein F4807DRAFT_102138 [Annulohypoxylon truncatum]
MEKEKRAKKMRENFEEEKINELQFHKRQMEEVRAVYEALKEKEKSGSGPPIALLEDTEYVANLKKAGKKVPPHMMSKAKTFNLYCADYVENCYHDDTGSYWRYVEFYEDRSGIDIMKGAKNPKGCTWKGKANGHVYVNCDDQFDFSTLLAPDRASTRVYWSDLYKDKHQVGIQFIGQDYVRMTVSRDAIEATERDPLPASCPAVFEFMGINRNKPSLKAQEEEQKQRRIARHSSRRSTLDSYRGYY